LDHFLIYQSIEQLDQIYLFLYKFEPTIKHLLEMQVYVLKSNFQIHPFLFSFPLSSLLLPLF